jgi:hypothetical protein
MSRFIRDIVLPTMSSPTDSTSWGIAGSITKPPPPPPDPGGFPEYYIDQIMKISMDLDDKVLAPQLVVTTPATMQQPGVQQVNPATKTQPAPKATKP